MAGPTRKLTAILSADVVGYSLLMAADEAATVATLKEYRMAIGRVVERHAGKIVNAPGDNILAQFPSAVEAVKGAVEIQKVLEGRNLELPPERRMLVRIGVNLGDVIEEADGTIYGDGVNIAARMEALAEGGGICVSSSVYDAVAGKIDFGFDFLGEQRVKNIDRPINVYRVRSELGGGPDKASRLRAKGIRWPLPTATAAVAVMLIAIAAGAHWMLRPASEQTQAATKPDPTPAAAEDPILALPAGPSIAVLPFDNLSGDPEQEFFSDGITEEIITELSRFRELFVIARNSTFQYKGKAVDVRDVGADLGVRYVVEGSVRKSGDNIRVSVQLLDAKTGANLWADDYDRELTAANIFAVQDTITEQIVATIADPADGIVSRVRLDETKKVGTENLDAYECVLHAKNYYNIQTPEEHFRIRECLETVIDEEPNYAEAWGWLSAMYTDEYGYGFNARPDSLNRALEAARRAVDLHSKNAQLQWFLARVHFFRKELDLFYLASERAIALNPNDTTVLSAAGLFMCYPGEWDRGIALLDKARKLNPYHPSWYYYAYYYDAYKEGLDREALDFALRINMPGFFWPHQMLAAAYAQLGMNSKAKSEIESVLELYPAYSVQTMADMHSMWNFEDAVIERMAEGLRLAGLTEEPSPSTNTSE